MDYATIVVLLPGCGGMGVGYVWLDSVGSLMWPYCYSCIVHCYLCAMPSCIYLSGVLLYCMQLLSIMKELSYC